jgi:hypothetical protein
MEQKLTTLQRLENLESALEGLDERLEAAFSQLRVQVGTQLELLEAIIKVTKAESIPNFDDKLQEFIKAARLERDHKRVEAEKAHMAQLLEKNVIKVGESVTADSLVVLSVFNPDGTPQGAGRVQFSMQNEMANPEVKGALVGQKVGFVWETPNKEKIELVEIYESVSSVPETV